MGGGGDDVALPTGASSTPQFGRGRGRGRGGGRGGFGRGGGGGYGRGRYGDQDDDKPSRSDTSSAWRSEKKAQPTFNGGNSSFGNGPPRGDREAPNRSSFGSFRSNNQSNN